MKLLLDYIWHRYLCLRTQLRGELCEPMSLGEFRDNRP